MEVIEQGVAPLFMDPDPDKARAFFRDKDRAMVNKTMTVGEAVEKFVPANAYVAVGGFGGTRIPTAVLHELVRRGRKGLGFSCHTATHDCQILAAGECFDRCDISYAIGLEARGLSPNARRYIQSAKVRKADWSNAGLLFRYQAAAMNVPFIPARVMLGTDTLKYSGCKVVADPYTGKKVALFPALYPDVAFIHVHEADVYGNCRIRGIDVADQVLARAAKRLIVTAERLVHNEEIRANPTATVIPYFLVDAVVEQPFGSFPGNMPYEYYSDEDHLKEWLAAEEDPAALKVFLDKYIYGVRDFWEYLERCGGQRRVQQLRWQELVLEVKSTTGQAEGGNR